MYAQHLVRRKTTKFNSFNHPIFLEKFSRQSTQLIWLDADKVAIGVMATLSLGNMKMWSLTGGAVHFTPYGNDVGQHKGDNQ